MFFVENFTTHPLIKTDRDDKIKLSFELLDTDNNGFLDLFELTAYMKSVFLVVANSNPEMFATVGPEEMALATAKDAMEFADADQNGYLSFEEFRTWMLSTEDDKPQLPETRPALDLERLKNSTGVSNLELDEVIDIFMEESNVHGVVDRDGFMRAMMSVCEVSGKPFEAVSTADLQSFYEAVDVNQDGSCDVEEISSAFSVLCQGCVLVLFYTKAHTLSVLATIGAWRPLVCTTRTGTGT